MAKDVSSMIKDLSSVPNIIGSLGLSIAAAQKAFNLDYLENLEKMLAMASSLLGDLEDDDEKSQQFVGMIKNMVMALAPSRYQFTETTLNVKLDLAQTVSQGSQLGLGINTGAVAVNAAMTSAFGYDARTAAEVTTVIHAISPDKAVFNALLEQAKSLAANSVELPTAATVDMNIVDKTNQIYEKMLGAPPARPVKRKDKETTGDNGGNGNRNN